MSRGSALPLPAPPNRIAPERVCRKALFLRGKVGVFLERIDEALCSLDRSLMGGDDDGGTGKAHVKRLQP